MQTFIGKPVAMAVGSSISMWKSVLAFIYLFVSLYFLFASLPWQKFFSVALSLFNFIFLPTRTVKKINQKQLLQSVISYRK